MNQTNKTGMRKRLPSHVVVQGMNPYVSSQVSDEEKMVLRRRNEGTWLPRSQLLLSSPHRSHLLHSTILSATHSSLLNHQNLVPPLLNPLPSAVSSSNVRISQF
ncbi:hypothetical protein Droror1_Dr00000247 [Drosera rotundifolia]